jgi:tetratricopeptide (TPR) repeat protein
LIILQTRAVWIALFFAGVVKVILVFISFRKKGMITLNMVIAKKVFLPIASTFGLFLILFFAFPEIGFIKSISIRVSSIFDMGFSSNEWRLQMWEATYNLFQDNKLIGVGAGNWKISIYPYYGEYLPSVFKHWRNPHNDFLGIASEKGFFGLLTFVSMFLLLIYYSLRLIFKSKEKNDILLSSFMLFGLLGYLIISFFSFPAERMNHLIFTALISAILISKYLNLKTKEIKGQKSEFLFVAIPLIILLYLTVHFGIINLNTETQMTKVLVLKDRKEWKQMEKYVDKANSVFAPLDPAHSLPIVLYKGLAKFNQQDYKSSLVYFKEAFEQHPNSISVLNNLGSAYGQLNNIDSSMVYQKKSLEIFPHYERGLTNLSKSYYLKENYTKAYQVILCCDPKSKNKEVGQIRKAIEQKIQQ